MALSIFQRVNTSTSFPMNWCNYRFLDTCQYCTGSPACYCHFWFSGMLVQHRFSNTLMQLSVPDLLLPAPNLQHDNASTCFPLYRHHHWFFITLMPALGFPHIHRFQHVNTDTGFATFYAHVAFPPRWYHCRFINVSCQYQFLTSWRHCRFSGANAGTDFSACWRHGRFSSMVDTSSVFWYVTVTPCSLVS